MATEDTNVSPSPKKYNVTNFNIVSSHGKQSKDLVKQPWFTINFEESLGLGQTANVLLGEVVIVDAVGFLKEFNLHGTEIIEFEFNTPQKEGISFIGRIYHISSPLKLGPTRQALSLKFCSAEKLISDQIKINKVFKNMKYSDMVIEMFAPLSVISGKKIYAEPTKTLSNAIISNRNPINAISWLAKRSKSSDYLGAGYVFYQRSDGIFSFSSLEGLIDPSKIDPVITYTHDMPEGRGSVKNHIIIIDYAFLSTPNTLQNIKKGMYASTLITNDLVKRQYNMHTWDYREKYKDHKHVNPAILPDGQQSSMLTNNPNINLRNDSFVFYGPKHFNAFGETDLTNNIEETLLQQNSQFQQMNNIKIRIVVPGDSQRRVGEIVSVRLPSIEPITDENPTSLDPLYSGRYLISRIKHVLTAEDETYETIMELVKDSYTESLPAKV
jgi:hypothetical protein